MNQQHQTQRQQQHSEALGAITRFADQQSHSPHQHCSDDGGLGSSQHHKDQHRQNREAQPQGRGPAPPKSHGRTQQHREMET